MRQAPRWRIDDEVRVIRNVRNDGTFPGADRGGMLLMEDALVSFGVRDGDNVPDEICQEALAKAYNPNYPNHDD